MAAKDANLASDPATLGELFLSDDEADFAIELTAAPIQSHLELFISEDATKVVQLVVELGHTPSSVAGGASLPPIEPSQKGQFISAEPLEILLRPFLMSAGALIVAGTDVITLTLKAPDTAIYNPTAVWDAVVSMWVAQVDVVDFQEGEWLLYGVSNVANSLPQFMSLWWGDYVDDIPETRQASLGRWKIEGTTLRLYEEDGTTVFKEFALKDNLGDPSSTEIFDKDPI